MINVKTLKLKKKQDEHKRNQEESKRISSLGGESVRTKWKNGGSWEYRQGRSKKQYEDSMKIMTGACLSLGIVIIGMIIFGIIANG